MSDSTIQQLERGWVGSTGSRMQVGRRTGGVMSVAFWERLAVWVGEMQVSGRMVMSVIVLLGRSTVWVGEM